jgi:hypothetical protein
MNAVSAVNHNRVSVVIDWPTVEFNYKEELFGVYSYYFNERFYR